MQEVDVADLQSESSDCNTPATMAPHERVRNARTLHPRLYTTCVVFDAILLTAIVLMLFLAGCVVAAKSLGVWG